MRQFYFLFFLPIIVFFSCKKNIDEVEGPVDFRAKFVGTYQGQERNWMSGSNPDCGKGFDYTYHDVLMSVDYGDSDSTLKVHNSVVELDENDGYRSGPFYVRFSRDSLYYSDRVGGIGCPSFTSFKGRKISDSP